MKVKNYRISLILAILLLLVGLFFGAFAYLYTESMVPSPYDEYAAQLFDVASFSKSGQEPYALAGLIVLEALMMLIFRRKKRASMYVTFIMFIIIYATALAYFHIIHGNPEPAALMSHVPKEEPWLILVCLALEAISLMALWGMLASLDDKLYRRHEIKMMKKNANKVIDDVASSSNKAASDEEETKPGSLESKSSSKTKKDDEKRAKKNDKEREKRERKLEKKAAKEERKDQKHYQRYMAKLEADARKAESKKKKGSSDTDETPEFFTTKGAPSNQAAKKPVDPTNPLEFPDIASIPSFRTIVKKNGSEKDEEGIDAFPVEDNDEDVYTHTVFESSVDAGVFQQLKEDIERQDGKEQKWDDEDYKEDQPRQKKSEVIEATLENLIRENDPTPIERGPIIGYEKKKEPVKHKSGIAPSGLSPDHPRYKIFEELSKKPNVSHFPSKSFVPENANNSRQINDEEALEEDVYSTTVEEFDEPVPLKRSKPIDPFSMPQKKKGEPISTSEREMPSQQNELLYSVGIGGLQSNELGYAAISKRSKRRYTAPSASILYEYPDVSTEIDEMTRDQGDIIVETLAQFHTEVVLDNIIKGPTVTMYELKLKEGTPVSRVRTRFDEISYNLGGAAIRILAPVPGKQAVGIEVPNAKRAVIGFSDMLKTMKKDPDSKKLRVPMILGRTITGMPVTIDVAKMPHLLIAGTTGSGKSVCINSFICTILYTRAPQDVRFIMVDPKVVELSVYNGIPHLLTPVITESKKVVRALAWLCDEMDRRYQVLSRYSVRNIDGLNAKIVSENIPVERMPYIVLIMDEFADLMTVVGKDIENYVARLAAKARAAGIHLVLATQRPSADVITGTIKNNFPARIAFAVSSATNSRIILDEGGAEALLGKGDMLFMNPSAMGFERIQGAFLSDEEVDAIVSFEKKNSSPDYLEEDLFEEPAPESSSDRADGTYSDADSDEVLYERAKEIAYEQKKVSASFLQRRMKIGYNRAARLIEMMEDDGIVGPANGSKPREILRYE